MKKLISVVIPAYNEEAVIDELGKRLSGVMNSCSAYDFEVVIVENGSVDLTFKKLKTLHEADPRFKVLRLSRNFTCEGGISAGLRFVMGDAAVIMNADLQDPPELIPDFLRKWEEGYEIVYGVIRSRKGVSLFRRMFSSLFYRVINALTSGLFPKNVSDFRLIDRKVYEAVNQFDEKNRFLRGMIIWTGFSQTGVSFDRGIRHAGKSKANFGLIFRVAMDGIYSFSYFPLKVLTILGTTLSAGSFLAMVFYLVLFFIHGRVVPGFMTILMITLFLFGMLFLALGIMGEYLSRIYDEVKRRPNFIVRDKVGL